VVEQICRMPNGLIPIGGDDSTSVPTATGERRSVSLSKQCPPLFPAGHSDGDPTHARVLADFTLVSARGQERTAIRQMTQAVAPLNLTTKRLKRLQTAVAEATMNAMEHGNHYRPDALVAIQVLVAGATLVVRITDEGSTPFTLPTAAPDLAAKVEGRQTKRGWGLVLIHNMVDAVRLRMDAGRHTVELVMYLHEEGSNVPSTV
jgi:serine/threonine-protein kinase RsbW